MAIRFTGANLYLKGTATAYLQDPQTNDIVYASDKFTTANVTTSVDMGEIRAGLSNPIVALIPSNSQLQVNFVAADFSLFAKGAQTGAALSYGAPVMVCQTLTATGGTLTLDVSGGIPVAAIGAADAVCFVQQVGAPSPVETGGTAYPINEAGEISGFQAQSGVTYKVWYHINRANAHIATISSAFDPNLFRFTAVMAVYDMAGATGNNQGTHVGNLHIIVPRLKLGGDGGGITGDQTTADTTSITGQALAYSPETIDGECDDCSGASNPFAYYIYVPCDTTTGIEGVVAQVGGVISVAAGGTYQVRPALVVNGDLVRNISSGFSYTMASGASSTVSDTGLITAAAAAEDTELTVTYSDGSTVFSDVVNVSVTTA